MDQEIQKDITQSASTPNLASGQMPSVNLDCAFNFETSADLPGEDENYDAVILYCEKDYEKAESIVKEINKIELKDGNFAKVELFEFVFLEHPEKFARLETIFKRCSYIFILCTETFEAGDNETNYMANECVMNSILKKDKKQPWQVIPIIDAADKCKLPFGLNSLQPIKWGHKYAIAQITKYIEMGICSKLVRSQSVPAAMAKSYNSPKSDFSSVCSGYASQDKQEENEKRLCEQSSYHSVQKQRLSTFNSKDDMVMSSLKCTRSLQESHPRAEFQESMSTSTLQSTKVSSHENQAIPKLRNNMETLSLQCSKLSLQEPQENMATLSLQSIKLPLQESQTVPESKDSMATPSTKPSLQEIQPVVDSQNSMTIPSFQSTTPSLQENQPVVDSQDSMATPSLQSTTPSLLESQLVVDSQNSMATPSLQSTTPSLLESQLVVYSQNSMATPSLPSTTPSLQESQPVDDSQDSIITPYFQYTKPSLQQNQSIPDSQNSMATLSFQSTKPSLQESQSIPDSQNSMTTPSLQSTNSSLQQNQSITDSQDSIASSYFQSTNSSMELSRSEESMTRKENNKDKERCVVS